MKRRVSGIVAGIYMVIISIALVLVPDITEHALSGWEEWIGLDIILVASSIIPAICLYVGRLEDNSIKNSLTYVFWIWYLVIYIYKLVCALNHFQSRAIVLIIVGMISATMPMLFIITILAIGGIEMSEEKKKEKEEARKLGLERQLADANSDMQRAERELKERQDQWNIVYSFSDFFKAIGCNDCSDIYERQQGMVDVSKTNFDQTNKKVERIRRQM